jgi:hypothetical protein
MDNLRNARMATSLPLGKAGPFILDQATVFKTHHQTKRTVAAFRVSFNTPAGAIANRVLMKRFSETDAVSYRQWQ